MDGGGGGRRGAPRRATRERLREWASWWWWWWRDRREGEGGSEGGRAVEGNVDRPPGSRVPRADEVGGARAKDDVRRGGGAALRRKNNPTVTSQVFRPARVPVTTVAREPRKVAHSCPFFWLKTNASRAEAGYGRTRGRRASPARAARRRRTRARGSDLPFAGRRRSGAAGADSFGRALWIFARPEGPERPVATPRLQPLLWRRGVRE